MYGKIDSSLAKARAAAKLIWYEQETGCLLCGTITRGVICDGCHQEFFQPGVKRCLFCGKLLGGERDLCLDCQVGRGPRNLNKVTSLGYYEGLWKEFIHRVKYKGEPYLLLPLAGIFASWAISKLPVPDLIVPVPLSSHKLAARGFNQAEVLGSILSRSLGIDFSDILVRTRDTIPQNTLGRGARIRNLQGAMAVKPGLKLNSLVIWLVDDVATTGATLGECAGVLRAEGAKEVYGFCLAAAKGD